MSLVFAIIASCIIGSQTNGWIGLGVFISFLCIGTTINESNGK